MPSKLTVVFRAEEESWNAFGRRIRETEGEVIVVLSSVDNTLLLQEEERKHFLAELAKIRYRVRLASKEPAVIAAARALHIKVSTKTRTLRRLLQDHPQMEEALRFFSPSLWRQHWRSRLQSIGLLSLPKVRIWTLIAVSGLVFLFVIFRLLPSADIQVWPREDVVTQTMNVVLMQSGAVVDVSEHTRTMPLHMLSVRVQHALTFTDISPEFIGTDAEASMTIINKSPEDIALREDSRLLNQAGMIFRLQRQALVPANGKLTVAAKADHIDLYGNVIGERGNVPGNVQWEFPGLPENLRTLVTAINQKPATGGRTAYRKVLQQKDLELAEKRLRQELLARARQMVEEERQERNAMDRGLHLEFLTKDDVIAATYTGFVLPTNFIGQKVDSIPVEGVLSYGVPAYDTRGILRRYSYELQEHAGEGKQILQDTLHLDPQKVVIIEYGDDLSWVKLTVDIAATEQFVIDPLTPSGVKFGKRVRDAVAGKSKHEALRILKNFPEVERVDISIWPPWNGSLPGIGSNISIEQQ